MDRERIEIKRYLARKIMSLIKGRSRNLQMGEGRQPRGARTCYLANFFAENERFLSRDALSPPLLITNQLIDHLIIITQPQCFPKSSAPTIDERPLTSEPEMKGIRRMKISTTQLALSVNRCDWHILAGNEWNIHY